jgi:hypothetical protein
MARYNLMKRKDDGYSAQKSGRHCIAPYPTAKSLDLPDKKTLRKNWKRRIRNDV